MGVDRVTGVTERLTQRAVSDRRRKIELHHCLLHLLELGVPCSKIELHHNDVYGRGEALMDWL